MYYGTLVSEGVIDLDGFTMHNAGECPSCNVLVDHRLYESCSYGCLNQCRSIDCPACGYHSCDDDCCSACHARSVKEESEELAISYGITSNSHALLFLADIETELMILFAKARIDFPDASAANAAPRSYMEPITDVAIRLHDFHKMPYSALPSSKEIVSVSSSLLNDIYIHLGWPDGF
nr:hypothetical protein [Providencia rettgeri]